MKLRNETKTSHWSRRSCWKFAGALPISGWRRGPNYPPSASLPKPCRSPNRRLWMPMTGWQPKGKSRPAGGRGFMSLEIFHRSYLAKVGPKTDRAIDPLWVSRQSLEAGDAVLKPGMWLASSFLDATRQSYAALCGPCRDRAIHFNGIWHTIWLYSLAGAPASADG